MKLKFAYLYIAFVISLASLVILSFLFYKRLNSHLTYSKKLSDSYTVVLQLSKLDQRVMELENHSRGYMMVRDSSFLTGYNTIKDSIYSHLETLGQLLQNDSDQSRRFLLLKSTVVNHVNVSTRNIERAGTIDQSEERTSVLRSKMLMDTFRLESERIERSELNQRNELYQIKEYYESFYPNYFNTISVWAGVITLISFFFINREVKMRSRYQRELEKKLQELNRSNSELRQLAYIASHDLQEPLRKIRTFSDKLSLKFQHLIDTEAKTLTNRIESSAKRLQELIGDMLHFASLSSREDKMEPVNLNLVLAEVLSEFSEQSKQTQAVIHLDRLPVINGSTVQLLLLFRSLLDNAFKFAKPGEPPYIRVSYALAEGGVDEGIYHKSGTYHKIVIQDRGIGFNNTFAEKIFLVFRRLHTQQSAYKGKGIGLAVAQRIVSNHNGLIIARGIVGEGAAFMMYFPAD